ncbi:MAG: hypothetical protein ACI9G9_001596 [Psychromonas sp.]|jgi:hypothetical protein
MNFITKLFHQDKRFEFIFDEEGLHSIGGEMPSRFVVPENHFNADFQYLGCISKKDKNYAWLPFDLHLICPIYVDFDFVFLDYANPNSPSIIYPCNTDEILSPILELHDDSEIIYKAHKMSTSPIKNITEENHGDLIAVGGQTLIANYIEIPTCPKSHQEMMFVCQILSSGKIITDKTNVVCEKPEEQELLSTMNFCGDGSLYVFIEPESKTVCYFIHKNN